jgi:hypothetical protein
VKSAQAHAGDDLFWVYAALWQACVRHPADARGFAEYARAFAERYEWRNCRLAVRRAFAFPGIPSPASAAALLAALGALAEHGQLGDLDWKVWFERLPDSLRIDANAIRLLVALGDQRARTLAPQVLDKKPKCAGAWLAAGMVAFEQEQMSQAYAHLRRAFEIDSAATLHTVLRDWSSPACAILEGAEKTDELAAWLSDRHAEMPELNLIPALPAPEALSAARRQRNQALDRGLPPLLFVPLYKSASTTVNNIITSGFDLPTVLHSLMTLQVVPSWLDDFMRGGSSHSTHLFASSVNIDLLAAAGAKDVIVHVRDPRQVMISGLEHVRRYPRELPPSMRKSLQTDSRARFDVAIERDLPVAIDWIQRWLAARDRFNVHFTTFEDFVRDRNAFIDRLIALYGGDTRYFNRDLAFDEPPGLDFHRRRGEMDEWRMLLDSEQTQRVNAMIPEAFWNTFGWSP